MSNSILETMIIASLAGGSILKKYFEEENFSVSQKLFPYDLVTSADRESQKDYLYLKWSLSPNSDSGKEGSEQIPHYREAFYVDL